MPLIDKPLHELRTYMGTNPKPGDFDRYWEHALAELETVPPEPVFAPAENFQARGVDVFDLFFNSAGGGRIHAKFLRPTVATKPIPCLLLFHGYRANSGDWQDKLPFVYQGMSVAALDCRGQGGQSSDPGGVRGNTHHGHIVRGLGDAPEKLLFRQIFLDTVQLSRIVAALPHTSEIFCMGGSQGGGLAIACASLSPLISRCVSLFPFLSDYQRVWEMDLAKNSYEELGTFFRMFDPLHQREKEIFETLGYIDVHNLASRIRARVLMALTLMDNICPPSTQFAVFNNISSVKEAVIYPGHGHEILPGFSDLAFRFLTAP